MPKTNSPYGLWALDREADPVMYASNYEFAIWRLNQIESQRPPAQTAFRFTKVLSATSRW